MEEAAGSAGYGLAEMSLEAMETEWQKIKHNKSHGT
jgi:hypothetical protein